MTSLILAVIYLAFVFFWWLIVVYKDKEDILFLFLSLSIVAFVGGILNNVWLVRFRHVINFLLPCTIVWLMGAKKLKFSMLTGMTAILLFLMIISGLWSNEEHVIPLKIKVIFTPILFLFAGSYIDDSDKLRRFFLALLPGAILLTLAFVFTPKIFNADDRLAINEINPNGIGGTACALLIIETCCVYMLKRKSWWLFPLIAYNLYIMILSGSRTSMIAFLGAAMVWGLHIWRDNKKVRFWYMFFCLLTLALALMLQVDVSDSRSFSWGDISGRDKQWETFLLNNNVPWCGCGFVPRYSDTGVMSWEGMLNIYLDVYVDLGYIGIALGSLILLLLVRYILIMWRGKRQGNFIVISCLAVGLLHGFCEGMAIRGNSVLTLIFMSSISMAGNMIKRPENFSDNVFGPGEAKSEKSPELKAGNNEMRFLRIPGK